MLLKKSTINPLLVCRTNPIMPLYALLKNVQLCRKNCEHNGHKPNVHRTTPHKGAPGSPKQNSSFQMCATLAHSVQICRTNTQWRRAPRKHRLSNPFSEEQHFSATVQSSEYRVDYQESQRFNAVLQKGQHDWCPSRLTFLQLLE